MSVDSIKNAGGDRLEYLTGFIEMPENISKFILKNGFTDEQIDYFIEIFKEKETNLEIVKIISNTLSIGQLRLLKELYEQGLKLDVLDEFIKNDYSVEQLQNEINKLPKKVYKFINKEISLTERLNQARLQASEFNSSSKK